MSGKNYVIFDRDKGTIGPGDPVLGVCGQTSWGRLCETLESCGEIKPDERITHLQLGEKFLIYRVEKRQ